MKRLFNLGILFAGITFIFSACGEDNNEKKISFVEAHSTYWGDYYGSGNSIFDLFLSDANLANSPNGNLNGIQAVLDINASPNSKEIPLGTYKSSVTGSAFTFQRGEYDGNNIPGGSYFRVWKNNKVSEIWLITSGSISIQKNGEYVISGKITTEDNDAYEFSYRGSLLVSDVTPWPETLTKGQVIYNGRVPGINGSRNMFTILLGGKDVTFPGLGGNDDAMRIELFSQINPSNIIVNGEYIVEIDTKDIFRIMDGYVDTDGYDYGTWYYTSESFSIQSGNMIVNVTGNNFKLDYEFYIYPEHKGLLIKGIYQGQLYYNTGAPVAPKFINRAPASSTKSTVEREGRVRQDKTLTSTNRAIKNEKRRNNASGTPEISDKQP